MVRLRKVTVMGGCKVCGKRMLTHRSPLIHRTCDACKVKQRQADNRKLAARRKAARHAAKQKLPAPRCQQCRQLIKGAVRLRDSDSYYPQWARRYCGNTCRQAAFREQARW
jgi:hypothetical protein